tara:strand:- start:557 stop:685 length:129 start_codon:yes stop_codon:yes gene_type:complete
MPDAVEAAGQDVDQEAADELGGGVCGRNLQRFMAIVMGGQPN